MRHEYDGFFQIALKDGRSVSIHSVDNGLQCGCTCPKCGEPLVAYNNPGNKTIAHFQHQSLKDCHGVYETAIHYLAKEVIQDQGYLIVPDIRFQLNNPFASAYDISVYDPKPVNEILGTARIYFDSVEVEVSNGSFRPDLKCVVKGKPMYVEIAVTHFVDTEKEVKINRSGTPVLEIDLSECDRMSSKADLTRALSNAVDRMQWINNSKIKERLLRAENSAMEIVDFIKKNTKMLKVYGKKQQVYCPRFKPDVDKVNVDDVCKRSCYCFVNEWVSSPHIGDEDHQKDRLIYCVGHAVSPYFELLRSKGIPLDESIHL